MAMNELAAIIRGLQDPSQNAPTQNNPIQMQQPDMQSIASAAPRLTQKRTLGNVLSDFFSGDRLAQNMRDPGKAAISDLLGNFARIGRGEDPTYEHTGLAQQLQDRDRQEQARNAFAQIFNNPNDPAALSRLAQYDPPMAFAVQQKMQPEYTPVQKDLVAAGYRPGTPEYQDALRRITEARYNRPQYIGNDEQGYELSPAYRPIFGQQEGVASELPNGTPAQTNVPQGSPLKGASNSMTIMGPKGPVQAWNINGKWYDNPEGR